MKSWQKWVLISVFVGGAAAAGWFFLGGKELVIEESTPEVDMEPVEEDQ